MGDLQDEILEKADALERLDYTLKVVGVRGWIALTFFIGLVVLTLVWGVTGTIPITISGKCVAFAPESSIRVRSIFAGVVQEIKVKNGDAVKQGDVLIVFENGQQILAPAAGQVVWTDIVLDSVVAPEEVVMWLQRPYSAGALTILGFFPLSSGQQIKQGMRVNIAFDQANTSIYGTVEGLVKEVLDYPISSSDYYMQQIPSQPLREYLIEGTAPTIAVVITPVLDPEETSGWKWTAAKGPAEPIKSGAIGELRIVLGEWKPITFLLPRLTKSDS